MSGSDEYHVLSIQSTVVSGYVGNKCATFALQVSRLQWNVLLNARVSYNSYLYFLIV